MHCWVCLASWVLSAPSFCLLCLLETCLDGQGNLSGGGLSLQEVWQPLDSIRPALERGWVCRGCARWVRLCSDGKFGVREETEGKVCEVGDGENSRFLGASLCDSEDEPAPATGGQCPQCPLLQSSWTPWQSDCGSHGALERLPLAASKWIPRRLGWSRKVKQQGASVPLLRNTHVLLSWVRPGQG